MTGVRRDRARAAALADDGIEPLALDLADPAAAARIPEGVDAIVACQAARGEIPSAYRAAYVEANRILLDVVGRRGLRAFVYTSSTGVFGQTDGGDVDETTPPAPASPTAEALVEAEGLVLAAAAAGAPARLVRLSGLYGPGRTGIIDRVRAGTLALGPGDEVWMNFCHLDDAVAAVLAAVDRGRPGTVYHASDASPAHRRDVVTWIAARLGIEPACHAAAAPPARAPNRRVLADRTRAELGLVLAHPSFRHGLERLLAP